MFIATAESWHLFILFEVVIPISIVMLSCCICTAISHPSKGIYQNHYYLSLIVKYLLSSTPSLTALNDGLQMNNSKFATHILHSSSLTTVWFPLVQNQTVAVLTFATLYSQACLKNPLGMRDDKQNGRSKELKLGLRIHPRIQINKRGWDKKVTSRGCNYSTVGKTFASQVVHMGYIPGIP